VNAGLSGSTLATVAERGVRSAEARLREDVVAAAPDVVVVQYGANDVLLGVPLDEFRRAASGLLAALRAALPAVPLVVVEPQPAPAIAASREPYDAALADAAAASGAALVRVRALFAPDAHAADSIHLDDAGHAALAEAVAAELQRLQLPLPAARPAGEGRGEGGSAVYDSWH
jgi:lysophospholipase L1-like esterase